MSLKCNTCGTSLCERLPLLSFDASVLPHHDLLTSNDQPRQQDIQTIENCIQDHEFRASEIEKLLKDIKQAYQFVDSRRKAHTKLAKAYKGTLSAIRKFPAELLEEIFLLCVRSCSDAMSPLEPPWVFGKVCRRWRSVVLSAPQLWSVIPPLNIWTGTGIGMSSNNDYLKLLSTSLRLSRTFPLCFELSLQGSNPESVCPVLNVISPHMNHCQSLKIFTTAGYLPLLDQTFRGTSCGMRSLTIGLQGTSDAFADYQSLSTFQLSPNIRDLRFSGPWLSQSHLAGSPLMHSWLRIPWSNLTSFVGDNLQVQYVTDLLHHAPSLVECSFTSLIAFGTSHFTAVDHSSLYSFGVSGSSTGDGVLSSGFWDHLTLPSLATLSIPLTSGVTVGSITSFFVRSSCSLSTLKFTGVALNDMTPLLASLTKAPLTNLILEFDWETSIDAVHLDFLIGQPLGGRLPFLPHLQHISTVYPYHLDSESQPSSRSFTSLNRLIESRLHMARTLGAKPLETVTLRCADLQAARGIFNELEGWSDNSPQHGQVTYTKISDWFQALQNTLECTQSTLPKNKVNSIFIYLIAC